VPARPLLPFLVALGGSGGVVGGEVVTLAEGQQWDAHDRYASGIQPPDHLCPFVAEVRDHQCYPCPEREQILDHCWLGEQGSKPGRIQLAREGQTRS
jgi:hypothetical protein